MLEQIEKEEDLRKAGNHFADAAAMEPLTAAPVPYRLIPKLIRYLQEEL
jgi:hypothetical protein